MSLTCAALQLDAEAIFEPVSGAALDAAVCCGTNDAFCRTRLTTHLCRVEEALRTNFPTPILKQVPGHTQPVWVEMGEKRDEGFHGKKKLMQNTGMQTEVYE